MKYAKDMDVRRKKIHIISIQITYGLSEIVVPLLTQNNTNVLLFLFFTTFFLERRFITLLISFRFCVNDSDVTASVENLCVRELSE